MAQALVEPSGTESSASKIAAQTNALQAYPNLSTLTKAVLESSIGVNDKHLQLAYQYFLDGNYAMAQTELEQSDFWTKNSKSARTILLAKVQQPEVYAQGLESYRLALKKEYVRRGLTVSDANLLKAATAAYDMGLAVTDDQTLSFVDAAVTGIKGGDAQSNINRLKQLAASMGVKYDDAWYNTAGTSIAEGNATYEEFDQEIKLLAKSQFPQFAKQIDAGLSVDQIASPYKSKIASVLELNPNEIMLDNQLMNMALNSKDKDGNLSPMSLYDFEKALRNDPRWGYTKNARESVDSTMRGVLQNFGFAW